MFVQAVQLYEPYRYFSIDKHANFEVTMATDDQWTPQQTFLHWIPNNSHTKI